MKSSVHENVHFYIPKSMEIGAKDQIRLRGIACLQTDEIHN